MTRNLARPSLLVAVTLSLAWPLPRPAQAQAVAFAPPADYVVGSNPQWVAVGDFNRDGIQDLAVASRGTNSVWVLLGNGNGTFQAAQSFPANLSPVSVAAADLNGDGLFGLATAHNPSRHVSVLLCNR